MRLMQKNINFKINSYRICVLSRPLQFSIALPIALATVSRRPEVMRTLIQMANIYSRIQPHRIPQFRLRFSYIAAASSMDNPQPFNECDELMAWLRKKTGLEISSVLSFGTSCYGRSLFASEPIEDGDCILKIPYTAHLTPDKIPPKVESLIVDDVGTISRLAVVLLVEKKLGKNSDWFPYLNSLPHAANMHNTIFWAPQELIMIQQSSVYHETDNLKSFLAREFSALKPVFNNFPLIFGDVRLDDFMHAYTLVISRAWGTSNGVSLVPFADFLNHDGASEAVLLSDDDKEISEVIADRNYSAGEEVLIRYGKFSNSTLMLDYGFTLPHNINDQVQIFMDVPLYDPLYKMKMELLHEYPKLPIAKESFFSSSRRSFIIKEVKTSGRKGKGIPQALRAFARVLTASTCEELTALANEASQTDGRLARRPLKNISSEIQAHCILLSEFRHMINCRDAAVKELESSHVPYCGTPLSIRRQMAIDLLRGEIRVLKSASSWITNYCKSMSACLENDTNTTTYLFS